MLLKKQTKIVIVSLLGFFTLSGLCCAISHGGLGIHPNESEWDEKNRLSKSWFIYTLEPGEVKEGKIDVTNSSEEMTEVKIYPVDAVTTKDGAFAPEPEDKEKVGVGAWITLAEQEFFLKPNEIKVVDFTIKVPENAEVGDHMGTIIVQGKEAPEAKKGTAMQVLTRVGARVYLTVPGEIIKELELEEFSYKIEEGQAVFYLTLANKGNVRISPGGEIEIKDETGNVIDKIEITEREVFPKDTIVLPTRWEKTMAGKFTALATVSYGAEKTLTKELSFEIEDAQKSQELQKTLLILSSIIGAIILLLIIFLAIKGMKRKKK